MMASFPLSAPPSAIEKLRGASIEIPRAKPLPMGIAPIDGALPDAGLPRGAVVELCAPSGLGHATRIALSTCASAQASSGDGQSAWCAWIDASQTLFAPGVVHCGVDLSRLLVVRPAPDDIARLAVRITASHIFSVVVIDRCGVPGASLPATRTRWNIAVRRLALAAAESDTTIILLSTTATARSESLPTAMRIELSRSSPERVKMHITKDRRGGQQSPIAIDMTDLYGVYGSSPDGGSSRGGLSGSYRAAG